MKLSTILFNVLLISSHLIMPTSNRGIYYNELQAFKNAPETAALFEQDVDGSSHTTQSNLGIYNPIILDNGERKLFSQWNTIRRILSSGNLKREITINKELSSIDRILITGLSGLYDDLVIATNETMPALYNYTRYLSEEAEITMPFLFISLKNDSVFSRKILGFRGSIVISQQLLNDVSDEELEALIAQQIAHIKYNHTNKKTIINIIALAALIAPAVSSLLVSKQFAKEADTFASKVAGKANGLITFYKRLEAKEQLRTPERDKVSKMLMKNAAHISMPSYLTLMTAYYAAEVKYCIEDLYNYLAYPSHKERINTAKRYLAQ